MKRIKKILTLGIAMVFLSLLLVGSAWGVESWAPNQYENPSRYYDSGTYVGYIQDFQWDQDHVDELHSKTGSNGKYQHEFRRDKDKWDFQNCLCQDYGWWTDLPDDVHEASEEKTYPWCDILDSDEEAELVTYSPTDIQADQSYYVKMLFKKRDTTGTLTLFTKAEYADKWYKPPADGSYLTETTENP